MCGAPIQLLLIGNREKVDPRQASKSCPEAHLEDALRIWMVRPGGHYQWLCIEVWLSLANTRLGLTKECYQVRVRK